MNKTPHMVIQQADFEALDRVKEAENRAKIILENAQKKKAEIVEKAKKQALLLLEETEKKAIQKQEERLLGLKKGVEKEKAALSEKNEKLISEIMNSAQKHQKKEAEFIVEKFLKEAKTDA